ncbi:unnamed protein product [Closterium sp. NIES-65]|nr:unnamed protein product [Closterium sp. NIES-65]
MPGPYIPNADKNEKWKPDIAMYKVVCCLFVHQARETDKVYTAKDFVNAEIELLGTINFEIETGRSCPSALEDLLRELRRVSRVGDFIKLSTCFTIYTLMHSDSKLRQHLSRAALPASIIVVAYLISVPKKQALFPVLQWVCAMNNQDQDEIHGFTRLILQAILE